MENNEKPILKLTPEFTQKAIKYGEKRRKGQLEFARPYDNPEIHMLNLYIQQKIAFLDPAFENAETDEDELNYFEEAIMNVENNDKGRKKTLEEKYFMEAIFLNEGENWHDVKLARELQFEVPEGAFIVIKAQQKNRPFAIEENADDVYFQFVVVPDKFRRKFEKLLALTPNEQEMADLKIVLHQHHIDLDDPGVINRTNPNYRGKNAGRTDYYLTFKLYDTFKDFYQEADWGK